jgi:hypothetical protein
MSTIKERNTRTALVSLFPSDAQIVEARAVVTDNVLTCLRIEAVDTDADQVRHLIDIGSLSNLNALIGGLVALRDHVQLMGPDDLEEK